MVKRLMTPGDGTYQHTELSLRLRGYIPEKQNLLKEINYGLFVSRRSDKKETVRLNCNGYVVIYSEA